MEVRCGSMPPYVLVIESDPDLQRRIGDQLRGSQYEVATEAEGSWARRSIAVRVPDLVVLDTSLSDGPGFAVAEAMRRDPETRDTPIVFVASRMHRGAAHRAEATLRYAPARYVIAPAELDELPAGLQMALSASGMLLDEELFSSVPPLRHSSSHAAAGRPPVDDEQDDDAAKDGAAERPADPEPQAPQRQREADAQPSRQARARERTAESPAGGDAELAGTLRGTPFPMVLQRLFARRANGSLLLRRGTTKKIVFFVDGRPLAVRSNVVAECLGQILARQRLISSEALQESLRRMKAEARLQGEILVEMGALSPTNLTRALVEQAEAKLIDVFGWTEGRFMFQEGSVPPARVVRIERSPAALILEGVRRQYDEIRQRLALAPWAGKYLVLDPTTPLRAQEMTPEPAEQAFLRGIDGRARLETVIDAARIPRDKAMLLVVALMQAGLAHATDTPAGPDGSRIAGPDRDLRPSEGEARRATDGARPPKPPELPDVVINAPTTAAPTPPSNAAEELYRAGIGHLRADHHREAVEALRQAARMVPDHADYRAALGWALFRVAPTDARASRAALAELRRALQLDPRSRSAHRYLGQLYAQTGQPDLAIVELEKLLELDPTSTEAADALRRLRAAR